MVAWFRLILGSTSTPMTERRKWITNSTRSSELPEPSGTNEITEGYAP
jgi:hypothetical protein